LSWKAPLAVKEGAPDAGDRKANSVGFDFHVLDISAVKQTASGGSLANQITAAGSAISADDELVVGNLSLLNKDIPQAITNFDILSLTGAGASYDFDRTAGELQTAANVKIVGFDADMETLDVSRTTSGNTITVSGGAARVVGSAHNDTLTGGAGNDSVFGGNGDDLIAGGGVQIDNVYTVKFNQLAASTAGQTITAFGVTKTYAASGDDVNTLGILFAATSAASFSDGSGNVAKAVSYDAAANTLRVTFGLDVSANVSPADVASSAATVTLVTNPVQATAFAAPGAGNDVLRGGAGKDTVDGGAGTDTIVVVGSVDTAQAAAYRGNAALNTQGEVDVMVGAFAVNMVTDLQTVHITTDVASGDSYNGGAGVDTLHIFGAANMTATTITNVEVIDIHSAVTFTAAQLDAMLVLNIDDGAEITVTGLALGQTPMQALQSVSRVNFPNGVYKLNGEIYGTGVEVATVTLNTGALNANETLTLTGPGGTLVVSASGGPGEFKTASVSGTAAQVGALLAGLPTSVLETELGYAPGRIAATAYNSTTNVFTLAFTVAAGNVTDLASVVSAGSSLTATAATTAPGTTPPATGLGGFQAALTNDNAGLVALTGPQLLSEGAVSALALNGVTTISVTSDVKLTAAVSAALTAAGIALVKDKPEVDIDYGFTITATPAAVNEDGPNNVATFNFAGFPAGPLAYSLAGATAGVDFTGAAAGTVTVAANGTASLVITTVADLTNEGVETLTLTAAGVSGSVVINDTSLTPVVPPTYTLTPVTATVNENVAQAFSLVTTGVPDGTVLTYAITGTNITIADTTIALNGSVTVNGGAASLLLTPTNDASTGEGNEVATITLTRAGATVATSTLNITDTSTSSAFTQKLLVSTTPAVTAVNGVAEAFVYDVTLSGGRYLQGEGEGTISITGFNVAEDKLVFLDSVSGTGLTEAALLAANSSSVVAQSISKNFTSFGFDAGTLTDAGGLKLIGVVDQLLATINVTATV